MASSGSDGGDQGQVPAPDYVNRSTRPCGQRGIGRSRRRCQHSCCRARRLISCRASARAHPCWRAARSRRVHVFLCWDFDNTVALGSCWPSASWWTTHRVVEAVEQHIEHGLSRATPREGDGGVSDRRGIASMARCHPTAFIPYHRTDYSSSRSHRGVRLISLQRLTLSPRSRAIAERQARDARRSVVLPCFNRVFEGDGGYLDGSRF